MAALTCVGNSGDAADIRTFLRLVALTAEALDDVDRQGGVVGTNARAQTAPPINTAAAHFMVQQPRFISSSFCGRGERRQESKTLI